MNSRPVLIGTTSVTESEEVLRFLEQRCADPADRILTWFSQYREGDLGQQFMERVQVGAGVLVGWWCGLGCVHAVMLVWCCAAWAANCKQALGNSRACVFTLTSQ